MLKVVEIDYRCQCHDILWVAFSYKSVRCSFSALEIDYIFTVEILENEFCFLSALSKSSLPLRILELQHFPFCDAFKQLLVAKGNDLRELLFRAATPGKIETGGGPIMTSQILKHKTYLFEIREQSHERNLSKYIKFKGKALLAVYIFPSKNKLDRLNYKKNFFVNLLTVFYLTQHSNEQIICSLCATL